MSDLDGGNVPHADAPVTAPGPSLTPGPTLTLTGAALASGRHRSALRRALEKNQFPNAYRDPADGVTWLIPVADLQAAGYELSALGAAPPRHTTRDVDADE